MKKKKRNSFKNISLVTLLVLSQVNVGAYAETITQETNVADSSGDQKVQTEASDRSGEVTSSSVGSSEVDTTAAEKAQTETMFSDNTQDSSGEKSKVAPYAATTPTATFESQSLEDNNSINYTWDQFMGSDRFNKKLTIGAVFSAKPLAGKKITIKLSEEFQYSSLPGFKLDGTNLVFDASKLPSQLTSVVTNATIEYPQVYGDTMSSSGTVTYELANTTNEVAMDITLGVHTRFLVNENGRDYVNPIQVTYSEEGNENFYDQTFEKISLSGKAIVPRFYTVPGKGYPTIYQSQTGTFTTGKSAILSTGGQSIEGAGAYLDWMSYKVKYDKRLELKKAVFENSQTTTITELPAEEDDNYKYAIITTNQVRLSGSVYYEVAYAAGVDPSTIESETKLTVTSTGGKVSYKPYNGAEVIDASLYSEITVGVQVLADFVNQLTSADLARSISTNNESPYSFLGAFQVENKQPEAVTDQKFVATFDTAQVNVQAMRIATVGGKTANIKVTTTTGRTITVPDNNATVGSQQLIDLAEYGQQANEYIASVEWTDDVPANYKLTPTLYGVGGIQYYGLVKAGVAAGTKITNNELKYGESKTFATDAETVKSIINVTSGSVVSGYVSSNGLRVKAGDKGEISAAIRIKDDTSTGMLSGFKGINIYVRELEGVNVIPEDFNAVDTAGNVFTVADGNVQVSKLTDNTGTTVYQFTIPDYDVNPAMVKKARTENVKVGVSISKTTPTETYSLADVILMEPLNSAIQVYNTGTLMGVTPNKYEVGDKAATDYIFTGLPSASLVVQASVDLNVTTAANLNGGEFIAYNGTSESIIDLNPKGQAQYGLKVSNSSGEVVKGYQAIIPIPKRGETTNTAYQLQDTDFGWTVNLTEPLDLSANHYDYTVLYATTYELDFNANSWKTWDQISDKSEIRAVYIQTNSDINSIENGTPENPGEDFITFNINMDQATADQDAGKVNIYKALIRRAINGVINNVPSEAVAIRLKTGVVKGQVYADTNRNGAADTSETGVNDITVIAYEKGTKNVVETTTTRTIDGVDGSYAFLGLDKSQEVDIVFENPVTDDSRRFVEATGVTIADDQSTAKIAGVIASSAQAAQVSVGLMSPRKVIFDAQGGTSSVTEVLAGYPDSKFKLATAPAASKEGYDLEGWYTAPTGGTKVVFPYEVPDNEDITLYAVYAEKAYTVTFDISANGGSGTAPSNQEVNYLAQITKPADPIKSGFTFVGWYDAAVGGTEWNFEKNQMPAHDLTLYAHFSIGEYEVTFNDEGKINKETVTFDELLNEPTMPVKTGYTFDGWYDQATGGTKWNFATDKMPAENITLYARYRANQYTVTFEDEGMNTTMTVGFDGLIPRPIYTPIKPGYSFTGWKDTSSNKLWDFATDKMPATDVTLVAQFEALDQVITLDFDGGTSSGATEISAPTDSLVDIDAIDVPTKAGYQFVGWFKGNDQVSGTITMPAGGLSLQAKWEAVDQVIRFESNGGTGVESIIAKTDSVIVIDDQQATTRDGYEFLGWFDENDQLIDGEYTVPVGGMTFTAKWAAQDQTITFDINGGDASTQPAAIVQPTDTSVDLSAIENPKRAGYQFVGWFKGNDQISGTITMPAGGLSLQAKWEAVDQVIRFESNGGTDVESITAKTDSVITIGKQQATTRAGYEFLGWFDENDQLIDGEYTVPVGGMTFTAKWAAQDQTITFDINGGDASTQPAAIVQPTDTSVDLSAVENPKKAGYLFVGWADASGKKYSGTITMPAGGLALIAQWEKEPENTDKTDDTNDTNDTNTTTTNKDTSKNNQGTTSNGSSIQKEQASKKILPNSGEKAAPFMSLAGLVVMALAILGRQLKRKKL
jgi:uncharacterized repeat protein (TIGR02543 family)/LPXTG-motif cell wall-anchored protein